MAKWVYLFEEGSADMRNLLGGKGANLAEMTRLGLPIPQGFTVTTEACTDYYNQGKKISEEIEAQIFDALEGLEKKQGKKFGRYGKPAFSFRAFGCKGIYAGDDGYYPEPGGLRMWLWKVLQRRRAIQGLLMIPTADLSKCFPMWLWRYQNHILKGFWMILRTARE